MRAGLEIRDMLAGDEYHRVRIGAQRVPVAAETQVVVAGGGPAGALAAIAAGRQGAQVILIEALPFLGGLGTGGLVHNYAHGVSGGLQDEVDRRTRDMASRVAGSVRGYHPELRKIVLEQMAGEAGVQLRLRSPVTGVLMEGRTIRGVITDGPAGRTAIVCEVCIDATGDGDVAALAGAEFTVGRETDGLPMPYSVTGERTAKGSDLCHCKREAGWVDPTDPWDYARGLSDARRLLWREPFGEQNRVYCAAPALALREGRQVIGDYVLTLDDEFFGQRFPDTIGRCRAFYDNHARSYANESHHAQVYVDVTGNFRTFFGCDVPYRCLLVRGSEGLLVAGRCASMTHDAMACLRMQKDMHRMGEAAGIAAALAVRDGVPPRAIQVRELQRELIKRGVLTAQEVSGSAAGQRRPLRPVATLIRELVGADIAPAMYELYCHGEKALGPLREALDGHDAEVARWAALVLGAHCRPEATELLVRMVLERDEAVPPHTGFVQPRWVSALVCLRYLADPRLNDVIAGTLETELDYPGHWLHALKALGRAGDPKAVPLIRDFLQSVRQKNRYWDERSIPSSGAGWRIELVAAEALIQLGDDQAADLARRYADDARLPVRRYARQILACAGLPTVSAGAAR